MNFSLTNSSISIIYSSATGKVFYNENSLAAGFGTGVQVTTLKLRIPSLSATNLSIQA